MELYPWVKAFHIVSFVAWMAGMLYLPRLFVYHCAAAPGSEMSETLKVMERRLLRAIMNPSMIATFVFGIWLLLLGVVDLASGWLHAKLLLVLVLAAIHGILSRCRRDFEADRNRRPARFFRIINEVPALLLIGIVVLVVVRPF